MDCHYDASLDTRLGYGAFSWRLHEKASRLKIPIAGSMELNYRCNLRCKHCYVSHGHTGIPGEVELSYDEIQRIIDEMVDAGTLWLLLTGGEPLLRRDFPQIYLYAKQKGLLVTVFTNGAMITPRKADFFAEWRPFSMEISLYGYSQETYEAVTGIPGSHARCMQGIELLLERGIPLRLKTVLMNLNYHEYEPMRRFAEQLGVDFRVDPIINAGVVDIEDPLSTRLTPEQVLWYDSQDQKSRQDWERAFKQIADKTAPTSQNLYSCKAGISSFHIDPYGRLSLCTLERDPYYDLRQGNFAEGWRSFLNPLVDIQFSQQSACGSCELRSACVRCPGRARLETGDPEGRSEYYCQVTHLRRDVFTGLVSLDEIQVGTTVTE